MIAPGLGHHVLDLKLGKIEMKNWLTFCIFHMMPLFYGLEQHHDAIALQTAIKLAP